MVEKEKHLFTAENYKSKVDLLIYFQSVVK
jgi:hypothetical protein